MSGIYIPGMEMPFTCLTCDFHKCAGGVGDFCSLTKKRQFRFKNRPKDCPLVPVPDHGDLVDKQRMAETNEQHYKVVEGEPGADYARKVVMGMLDQAPIIIPADKEAE